MQRRECVLAQYILSVLQARRSDGVIHFLNQQLDTMKNLVGKEHSDFEPEDTIIKILRGRCNSALLKKYSYEI